METYLPLPIEGYALIGNTFTSALVGRNGSIDWLCMPHFDSAACFAALLGTSDNGRWLIAPQAAARSVTRRYQGDTLILETVFTTDEGEVAVIDFMPVPPDDSRMDLIRIVEGRRGRVAMCMDLALRFDYGRVKPWVRRMPNGINAIAGPDAVQLTAPVDMRGEAFHTVADFTVAAGERVPFSLTWRRSHLAPCLPMDAERALDVIRELSRSWIERNTYRGKWDAEVKRSLLTLKALTFSPTGAIVAAPTTSLPEHLGGVRNWDYRYCWLRDATLTLYSLLTCGYRDEAAAWRAWLLRAIAGDPSELQIMYGLAGERRLLEHELDWLPGYHGSKPVRIGNAAFDQFQLDVYGEVMDALHAARRFGLEPDDDAWRMQQTMLHYLEDRWDREDEGIWEVRGPRRHFTHSNMMAWVAFDRAVKAVEESGRDGPVERWRAVRDRIHADVCARGYSEERGTFVQYYGGDALDAALLMIPLVGFLPAEDPRVRRTIEAIERELTVDGLVLRYHSEEVADGLPPGEGAFLACSFWLCDALAMIGRRDEAVNRFEKLLAMCNDVGLLAEEYDPKGRRQLGNFPQAFSHIALINTAHNLNPSAEPGPGVRHAGGEPDRAARSHQQGQAD
ncbi:GH15 family glucan-1,4-alpha-glucosidase [Constrictibacter sp. MBR-5]|jgi:GH15 family glucan-1,4-alpha-glucosidase|uniref:glycoside hydrolase family 15 protein n=1 Tax=Constrictibacter sp. MBR-5 TaxID=3156467 RepID=UPI0033948524